MFDDRFDEDSVWDDTRDDFFDLNLDKRHDLLLRCDISFFSFDQADGDGDFSSGDDILNGSRLSTSCGARTVFLKADLYGYDLNLVMRSTFDELCERSYETSLVFTPANDGVHERGRFYEVTQHRIQREVQFSTLDHQGYLDINNFT